MKTFVRLRGRFQKRMQRGLPVRSRTCLRGQTQAGAALIIVILFFIMISVAIIQSATIGAIVELRTYHTLATSKFSYVAAEAGIEDIFYRTLVGKQVPASETIVLNNATSTVIVSDVSVTQRDIYSTGNAKNEVRKLYLSISKNKSSLFPFAAQIGDGGIIMKNGSLIDGLNLARGDVYADGQILGAPGVTITGNAVSASVLAFDRTASSTLCSNDEVVGKTNPNIDYAESFMMSATTSSPLAKVSFYIKRNNNPRGANIQITADNGGKPSTVPLATGELEYSSVNTTYSWVDVPFASPAILDPWTTYWIVMDATQDSSKYWYWCRGNSDTYATGTPMYKQDWSSGGSWTSIPGDMTFKLTFGGGASKIDQVSVSGIAKADAITSSSIGGDAYYQTISGSTVTGTSHPGSPTPPYVPLPLSTTTIAQWKADAESGGTIDGSCGVGGVPECNTLPMSLGLKKINGDLVIDGGNDPSKVLTITGTLYVTGNVLLENKAKIQCAFGYLGNSCIIIADGYIDINNNSALSGLAGSGLPGSYILMLSTMKGCLGTNEDGAGAGCGTNNSAIALKNNVTGALFYTPSSLIDVSNNAIITAVVGYMLQLQNGTKILYDSSVANLSFTAEPVGAVGTWSANRWAEY